MFSKDLESGRTIDRSQNQEKSERYCQHRRLGFPMSVPFRGSPCDFTSRFGDSHGFAKCSATQNRGYRPNGWGDQDAFVFMQSHPRNEMRLQSHNQAKLPKGFRWPCNGRPADRPCALPRVSLWNSDLKTRRNSLCEGFGPSTPINFCYRSLPK